jgi:hypothetical protein
LNGEHLITLVRAGGNEQFATALMGYFVRLAKFIKRLAARKAELSFEGILWVINASMNDLAIARGNALANALIGFEHQSFAAPECELAGNRKTHNACPYNQAIYVRAARHSIHLLQTCVLKNALGLHFSAGKLIQGQNKAALPRLRPLICFLLAFGS